MRNLPIAARVTEAKARIKLSDGRRFKKRDVYVY